MNYFLKHFLSFSIISVISNIIFFLYLKSTDYAGGEIGMAPFITILNCLITFFISFVVIAILRACQIHISIYIGTLIFSAVSTFVLFFYFKIKPFSGYLADVDLWSCLSVIFASVLVCAIIVSKKNFA